VLELRLHACTYAYTPTHLHRPFPQSLLLICKLPRHLQNTYIHPGKSHCSTGCLALPNRLHTNRHQCIWCLWITQHTTGTVTAQSRTGHISSVSPTDAVQYAYCQRTLMAIGQRTSAPQPASLYCNSHAMSQCSNGRNGNIALITIKSQPLPSRSVRKSFQSATTPNILTRSKSLPGLIPNATVPQRQSCSEIHRPSVRFSIMTCTMPVRNVKLSDVTQVASLNTGAILACASMTYPAVRTSNLTPLRNEQARSEAPRILYRDSNEDVSSGETLGLPTGCVSTGTGERRSITANRSFPDRLLKCRVGPCRDLNRQPDSPAAPT
jgi:hypothetical protein